MMLSPRIAAAALVVLAAISVVQSIGVNYGTLGDNLPPPAQVAEFLKSKTTIDRIKIFDVNPDILRAFANTGISVAVTVPNGEIPNLTNVRNARRWITANIKPFYPQTKINYILVGNEILHWGPENLRTSLVAAMESLHKALHLEHINYIQVTTAHSLAILEKSEPPSQARFRAGWDNGILAPMLEFHRRTKTTFMVNPYPYFAYSQEKSDFAVFRPNKGVYDRFTKKTYTNMFDFLLDAVFVSMMRLGYSDVEIVVGETGWSSQGETFEQPKCSVANAASYNGGLVRKYNSGSGTPLMPHRKFETYIFALFNENKKDGSMAERNFGLFRPDFSAVYDIGIMRNGPSPIQNSRWCIAKADASDAALQANINYACSQGIDCKPIQNGGVCSGTLRSQASFAMNSYYQLKGHYDYNCDFSASAIVTSTDPSTGSCKYTS